MTAPHAHWKSSSGDSLPELVAESVDGNRTAWNSLVERFAPLVASVTQRFRLTQSDADDVQQTVLLRLVENLPNLREPRALPGWIVTTTRHEALRTLSANHRVEAVDPQSDARLDTVERREPAANLVLAEQREAVHAGLAELRSEQRELLLLTVADPKVSYRQISQRLGMPTGSIGPTRGRCLRHLRATKPLRTLSKLTR